MNRTALEAAVQVAEPGGGTWARTMDDLAESWAVAGDLDRAIGLRREALERLADAVPGSIRLDLAANLGIDVMARYRRTGDVADLREACAIGERVRAASPPDARVTATANLAGRLAVLATVPGEPPGLLDRARELIDEALGAAPADDPDRWIGLEVFAGVHVQLWQRDGDRARLDAALRAVRATSGGTGPNVAGLMAEVAEQTSDLELLAEAESLARAGIADGGVATATVRVTLHRLLASVLLTRYEWTDDRAALTDARAAAEDAVRAATTDSDRALALSVRSTARSMAARISNDRLGFAAAVGDARQALAAAGDDWRDGEYAANLATLLTERYDLFGDSTDLDEAIGLLDRVLGAGPPADMAPGVANNQASNLLNRFERDGRPEDLDRAIGLAEQAVARTAPDSAELAARHDTAGRLHAARAHHHGDRADLRTALRHAERAVDATADGSPDRALYLNNWAGWLTDRWTRDGDEDALNRAIGLLERALAAAARAEDDVEGALAGTIAFNLGVRLHERFDLGFDRGHTDVPTLQRASDLFGEVIDAGYPHLAVPAGKRLGDIFWRLGQWSDSEESFRAALTAAGELTGLRPQRPDKERARSGVQGIGALAALAAARAGDVRSAAVHLEQASATLIAEAVGVRAETVSFDGIVAAAKSLGRHVLLLGCTLDGGIAVLVAPDGSVAHAELPLATEPAVAEQATVFRRALRDAEDRPDAGETRVRAADRFAAWTLDALVGPLLPLVAGAARLAVLPLGRLAWLPLTSCGAPGAGPALGRYEPLLLIRADTSGRAPAPPAGVTPPRVLVWADTGPEDRPIPAAAREARRVARGHPGVEPRIDRSAEGDAVLDDLLAADLVHLACHCDVDVDHPQDTVLRVRPPIRVGHRAGVARRRGHVVLSACDAALTGATLPDEALSAATAFLLAGAGVVTAPVWPVNDATAPALMGEYHAKLAEGLPPAAALAAVQRQWSRRSPAYVHGPWVVTAWPDTAGG